MTRVLLLAVIARILSSTTTQKGMLIQMNNARTWTACFFDSTTWGNFEHGIQRGEKCCDGNCAYSCVWTTGSIAGAVVGTIIFFAIASCCCCACCPYYRYRTPGTVIVNGGQPPYQQIVTTSTNTTQQGFVRYPPPGNYNQPPPTYPLPGPGPNPSAQV
ncbi:hypothetical protein AWC38_SpisGene9977 [Stylophora pistillata]|uniref:Uncharacterized protein n=1 Tax=Stylophora pistillata TaxID=50429 RepID=A0A2B4SAA2_STYPI|nr:hypothetical protein AWC38_SpisGene9977 [Stylophora pistillata]